MANVFGNISPRRGRPGGVPGGGVAGGGPNSAAISRMRLVLLSSDNVLALGIVWTVCSTSKLVAQLDDFIASQISEDAYVAK